MTLEVKALEVREGNRRILGDVDLKLDRGAITAVLGANGAGKSELVLAIAGILPVSAGSVHINGADFTGAGPGAIRRAGVAAVPEGHRVLTRLSVDDNLRAAGALLSKAELEKTLADTYALFPELAERKPQLAGTMSGGQQQMLALGHAMMSRPSYLLIDEMSLGLAPLIVKRLMKFVTTLKERNVGVLLIEQFTDMALAIADHAVVLRGGTIRYSGRAAKLVQQPDLLDSAYFGIDAARHGAHVGV
ncbi:ABC transporter ATP-binding protein [Zhengella mangrovi]|uniref:ABC transporter ATP-binding protein n=1 Tax=Zhengella mangrovi TaxID=1982044 RepID=A0A2G1QQX4_9HYPH|nr:ABC transporter ATP-binding protein [Zhengella mangrovi]PHP67913.1 ABC transporter ATP-binding protein [Zhengella mangrovi]